jgi:neutral ceramidase
MTLLRLKRADGKVLGILNWYAVHGTSARNTNTHVTGDNKGVAALMFEKEFGASPDAAPGFVAGFSQANVGDTSPNVLGQWCTDGSGQCNLQTSTCADGKSTSCLGRGPMWEKADHGIASAYEIGRRQFETAKNILASIDNGTPVTGPSVKSFHFFNDMRYFTFTRPDGSQGMTCPAALGESFAAGTTDGPGVGDFAQAVEANPFWKFVGGVIKTPSAKQKECQGVKKILLDVGEMDFPFPWTANIVDIQVLRVGQLLIIISSPEASTMAGRRWRNAVGEAAKSFLPAGTEPVVVLGGPANTYTHYAVTPEEYDIQRYEGSSTLFGRDTLNAYINLTVGAISYLSPSANVRPEGIKPPDNRAKSSSFVTEVVYDNPPIGKKMGQVLSQPRASINRGDTVTAVFQGANPRNNLRLEGTFAAVEMRQADGSWKRVRDDTDWYLVYSWTRTDVIWGASTVQIDWETVDNPQPGTYRLKYYGDQKMSFTNKIVAFEGTSNEFTIA